MSLIRCDNVSFSYTGKTVVSKVSFEVNQGDYLCIIGENGAGKSTLIKGILHLKKSSSGKIEYGDGLLANEIGYLPQQTISQKDFPANVKEVVMSGCLNKLKNHLFYTKECKEKVQENMELLGIADLSKKSYRELSGGQQQRVLLARALCASSKILLLDEPVTGLDPIIGVHMYELIRMFHDKKNMTIVMVTHDIPGALNEASHILHLNGEQKFFGLKEDYLKSEVSTNFLGGLAI